MELSPILQAVLSMGGIGFIFAVLLTIANKTLKVEGNPKVEKVEEALPGIDCGACGYPSCEGCAKAMVEGEAEVTVCSVSNEEGYQEIADILGVEYGTGEREVAVVLCQGGDGVVKTKSHYEGVSSCMAATFAGGGERACQYGCIGKGDCVEVCDFDAIYMNEKNLPVVDREKCTGCGKCVEACPRDIIELHSINHHAFVLCKNEDEGKKARQVCDNACIGCGLCVKFDDSDAFIMENNLASNDQEKYDKTYELPTDKCPTGCLVLVGEKDEE